MLAKLAVACLWLVSWLPFRAVGALGSMLGTLLYALPTSRRAIGRTNLRLCFPTRSEAEREAILRGHFIAIVRMVLEYGYCWFASPARLRRLVAIEGLEHLTSLSPDTSVILSMPHFTGLDLVGLRLSLETPTVTIYARQKNPWLDAFIRAKRLRLNTGIVFSRQEGVRSSVRALREGYRLYYLPDQDHGLRDSVFADFFGVPAATITGLPRLAALTRARVIPCYPRREAGRYTLVLQPPLADFPSGDLSADARRMNAVIEQQVLAVPKQYFWLHRRFKTRPPGRPPLYEGKARASDDSAGGEPSILPPTID
ncbi:lipid A biosynthesis acyltransferase [Paucibacter sp. R3-3]|uniref:Lipid A biosynthesis acyltransferase n=1 Tax=Roseateles agri TaxID=3098619 RepID=A0ABU5DQI6_9BURK|nr:lipid A biosynthesis acyltransferase [Paucibacter sp. R3-3]MDY0748573.1 lipid A biosynthesis acyltransferase [Paucibacter sp. R3-3]